MCSETSGHFRRLLTLIICGVRDPIGTVDPDRAKEEASALYDAGEGKMGTDEEVFNRIFTHDSFAQLRLVFDEYKSLTGETIEQAIKHEMDGELLKAMMAIIECVQSPGAFFANRLHNAMDGMGTDDQTLIRIIVSRAEIDLGNIKDEYERIYNRTLMSAVKVNIEIFFMLILFFKLIHPPSVERVFLAHINSNCDQFIAKILKFDKINSHAFTLNFLRIIKSKICSRYVDQQKLCEHL